MEQRCKGGEQLREGAWEGMWSPCAHRKMPVPYHVRASSVSRPSQHHVHAAMANLRLASVAIAEVWRCSTQWGCIATNDRAEKPQ